MEGGRRCRSFARRRARCLSVAFLLRDQLLTQIVDIFVDWIYSQKVPSLGKETLCSTVLERADGQVMRLKATILGNRLFAPAFVEACRRNLIECIMEWRGCYYATIIYAFANLATDDLLLKMMVDVDVKNEAGNESQQKRRSCGRIYLLTFCSQSEINSQRWLARADSPVRILCLTHPITTGTPQKSHERSAKRRMKSNSAKLQKVQGMSGLLQVRHTDTPCYQGPRVEKRSSTDTSLGVIGGSTKLMTYRSTH